MITFSDPYVLESASKTIGQSFYESELKYLKSIKNSDVHIVYNHFRNDRANISEYISIEMAYAMVLNKPVFLFYKPVLSKSVSRSISSLINKNLENLFIARFDLIDDGQTRAFIAKSIINFQPYNLTSQDKTNVLKSIKKLLSEF